MANAITISLVINAALGVGWLVRAKVAAADATLDSELAPPKTLVVTELPK